MESSLIIQTSSLVATLIIGFWLKEKIKSLKNTVGNLEKTVHSQKELMASYSEYIKAINWKDVEDFWKNHKVPAERQKVQDEALSIIKNSPVIKSIGAEHTEMQRYIIFLLNQMEKNSAKQSVSMFMPNCERLFQGLWLDAESQTPGIPNSHREE